MKLISLNTWGGRIGEPLMEFFKNNNEVDIFCLQEIYSNSDKPLIEDKGDKLKLFEDIQALLPDHVGYFRAHAGDYFGLATFVKKDIDVKEGELFIFKTKDESYVDFQSNHPRNIQHITFETGAGSRTIINFHGLWTGVNKDDTPERLTQSKNIVDFIKSLSSPVILTGDFNLLPETQSLKAFEEAGLENLIRKYGVTSTRSSLYTKPVRFADYMFTSKEITIHDFKVLPDEVSDHLAMYLDFE